MRSGLHQIAGSSTRDLTAQILMEMEDGACFSSAGGSSECTGADDFDPDQKEEEENQWSSDSTIILDPTPDDVDEDISVPELRRTDSVIVRRMKRCRWLGRSLANHTQQKGPKKLKWTNEEIQAVEKTLMDHINSGKVPGKTQCLDCIEASGFALKGRSWVGVKYYVKHRNDALKRKSISLQVVCVMTPREQLRKMTALGEQGALDEKHWYRLVNGMSAGELRQRQELIMRNQMAMAPQILSQGQQRLQGVPAQYEPRFMERELVPPSDMVASDARQMHMGPHLGPPLPPHANVMPGRAFPGAAGYGFLPSEPMETVARRQEFIHKQNIARMEMNAILHQKELENAHQKGLMGIDNSMSYPSNHMAFRGRQRMPDGHDVYVHRPTLDELHSNSILMSASPYPPISTLHRERGRRAGRRPNVHKSTESHVSNLKGQAEDKSVEQSPGATSGEEKEVEAKGDMGEECPASKAHHQAKIDSENSAGGRKNYKEGEPGLRKACVNSQDGSDVANSGANDKDLSNQCSAFQEKFMYPSTGGMPYMFPVPGNGFLPPGPPNLFLNSDEVSEDIRKWTVNDVYNFINSVPTCSEYAQTFKDHMIDGETLPLLSEEHLLDTLGLKLGPALKIRSQVSRRMGNMLYMMNLPLSTSTLQANPEKPADRSSEIGSPVNCNSEEMMASPRDPDVLKSTEHLHETENNSPPSASSETA